jgi:RNA polymerase sigma-70 factor (ECF subfamily)
VITGLDGFDGRSSLATWIIAILLNKARTAAKSQRRYVQLDLDAGGDEPEVDPARFSPDGHWIDPPPSFDGADPERIVAGRQIWEHVRAAIDRLPPAQKAVLLLRDVEGRDAAEACSLLGITAENQRILLHRARARLRALVEDLVRGRPVDPLAKA